MSTRSISERSNLLAWQAVLALVSSLVCHHLVHAQAPASPAHWTVSKPSTKPLPPGSKFHLQLAARIDPGWHIYALEEPEDGPVATVVGLAEGDLVNLLRVSESKPRMIYDPFFRRQTGLFNDAATFDLELQLPPAALPHDTTLHVQVRYQSCNDKLCLPPHTEMVALPLGPLLR